VTIELTLLTRVAYRGQEITGPRPRGLLALLAGDLRRGCSTARLVEGLWPEELPEHPAKALQVVVSRTRAQLGADVIASTPTGYRLSLADEQVDASAVLLRAAAGARLAGAGDHASALAAAEAGLALWDGAPDGAGTGLDDPVTALRAERAPTWRSLIRARALALARLGLAEAAAALTDLARERPRDEEVLVELLRCEAATLGPSAALARYEAYRRSLRDELGTDPGPALQAMQQQLLQGSAPVVRHGVPHEPNHWSAATATSPRWRTCCAPPGSPRSSARAAWARPGSPTRSAGGRSTGSSTSSPSPGSPPAATSPARSRRSWPPASPCSPRPASTPGRPTWSPASRPRSVPARRCWCWTTASTSCAAPPTWSAPWCR
jgi:DNA-binding SARP family transcriptional activator